ncbi:efflux RND transporter periplasmic adaptor subunit [Desulfovibrio sp. ZJ200]|uniref:efflux RND transporter periplasmic adaptor subunit n=1 Tax=Desulfovibrio sp. ZJ200 TaxID=2709792 RepID=UPI0032166AB1
MMCWAGILSVAGCGNDTPRESASFPHVQYQRVTTETITLKRELPGRVAAFKVSEVRPQVSGILQKRLFEEGMDVEAGQVLYQIDPSPYNAAYNNARANLRKAEAREETTRLRAERHILLAKSKAVPLQARDDAVAAYHEVRAEIAACRELLANAKINLDRTRIVAPVSGRIGRSFVTEGALVTQNQQEPLATIRQLSPVFIDITQSSAELIQIRQALSTGLLKSAARDAARVRLHLEGGSPYTRPGSDEWLEGELLFSDISVDEHTGTVSLRAGFDNPEGLLLPGMYVRAELIIGVREQAILLPQKSVTRDMRNRPQVFVLEPVPGEAPSSELFEVVPRLVDIEGDHAGRWLVRSGLTGGERLLVEGIQKVRPGQIVIAQRADAARP